MVTHTVIRMPMAENTASLFNLLRFCSANLPVGGYTFSQGLEYAIDSSQLASQQEVFDWLLGYANASLKHTDLPLMRCAFSALQEQDEESLQRINALALAVRESKEMLLADTAMGCALMRLLRDTSVVLPVCYTDCDYQELSSISMITAFVIASHAHGVECSSAMIGYCWTVLESQVLAAAKLLPMGQTDSQRMLSNLQQSLPEIIEGSKSIPLDNIGLSLPGLAMASALHETQYSRLYRS